LGTQLAGSRALRPSLINPINFLLATRDTGYKSTVLAIAEFIDNSLQAGARRVSVDVGLGKDPQYPIEISVVDDGDGMDGSTLMCALTFGGSSRFNDRSALGRYGMGLPNGALSRGRRVEVYTWQGSRVLWSRLDIDEVIADGRRTLPAVEQVERPPFVPPTRTGTVVRLLRCDRIEYKRPSTLVRRLEEDFGRIYRRFLGKGLDLRVNDRPVVAVDPLFLQRSSKMTGGRQFGDVLAYQVPTAVGTGNISVRFSELPIDRWHWMSLDEKREIGVTNAPCVSVVRAEREIDRGWFFMGAKRRENYDDWWRCEVSFDPALDELFGITHSKQAVSPRDELLEILVPDLEPIARALNGRVRHRFELVKATAPLGAAERQASRAEASLPSMPRRRDAIPDGLKDVVESCGPAKAMRARPYQIIVTELPTTSAFEVLVRGTQLLLLLNARHPLYRDLYGPLAMSESTKDQDVAKQVALAVLAAARAEVGTWRRTEQGQARRFRQTWADVLATFLNA
jgi:hypothetical protein